MAIKLSRPVLNKGKETTLSFSPSQFCRNVQMFSLTCETDLLCILASLDLGLSSVGHFLRLITFLSPQPILSRLHLSSLVVHYTEIDKMCYLGAWKKMTNVKSQRLCMVLSCN